MKRVFVLGSINVDLSLYASRWPRQGETLSGDGFLMGGGGKGANQAVAAARLGASVSFIGAVGDDVFGHDSLRHLSQDGIDVSHVAVLTGVPTGVAMIIVANGDNRILLSPGANHALPSDQIRQGLADLHEGDLFITELENTLENAKTGLRLAKQKGAITLFNPSPFLPFDLNILSSVDYLVVNEDEAEKLVSFPLTSQEEIKAAFALLAEKGLRNLIVTLGARGSVLVNAGGLEQIPAFAIKPVDSTGAGDTYLGAFAAELARCHAPLQGLSFASKAAAKACLKKGAQASIPFLNEMEGPLS